MDSILNSLITSLKILVRCAVLVGRDPNGNSYYESKNIFLAAPKVLRRWVIYGPKKEIHPLWHGWFHHYGAAPSKDAFSLPQPESWQKINPFQTEKPPLEKGYYVPWTPS